MAPVPDRVLWDGCPYCFSPRHTGPCPPGILTAARAPARIVEGIPDADLLAYELRAEAAMVQALQQVMDTVADRIGRTQTATGFVREVWDGCLFCLNPRHPGPCAKPKVGDTGEKKRPKKAPGGGGGGGGGKGAGAGDKKAGGKKLHEDDEAIRNTYNYTDAETGVTTEVVEIKRIGPYVDVHMDVRDKNGAVVGNANRIFDGRTPNSVEHASFELDPGMQGQGFATRFNAHAEQSYRDHGIEKITLTANFDVGGYAWARAGYGFAGPKERGGVAARAREMAKKKGLHPDVRAEINRVADNPNASPIDFAMIGHTSGAKTWPGKQIMLGAEWDGVKQL